MDQPNDRPLILTTLSAACLIGGVWLAIARDTRTPAEPRAVAETSARPADPVPRTASFDVAAAALAEALHAQRLHAEESAGSPVPVAPARSGVGARGAASGDATLPSAWVAARTGLSPHDPRLEFVARWTTSKFSEDHEAMDAIDDAPDHDRAARMAEFNAATEARRLELVQSLGLADAERVANEFCLYRFDLTRGNWQRIDAAGRPVPFKHEDDDIWQGFERSNRNWSNHRRR
ncbi:MAG: hypothetical protein IT457_21790 [Planctomycetes bacterium]|nr:hypothetical protein [Planctomycetota bacterium]